MQVYCVYVHVFTRIFVRNQLCYWRNNINAQQKCVLEAGTTFKSIFLEFTLTNISILNVIYSSEIYQCNNFSVSGIYVLSRVVHGLIEFYQTDNR